MLKPFSPLFAPRGQEAGEKLSMTPPAAGRKDDAHSDDRGRSVHVRYCATYPEIPLQDRKKKPKSDSAGARAPSGYALLS